MVFFIDSSVRSMNFLIFRSGIGISWRQPDATVEVVVKALNRYKVDDRSLANTFRGVNDMAPLSVLKNGGSPSFHQTIGTC